MDCGANSSVYEWVRSWGHLEGVRCLRLLSRRVNDKTGYSYIHLGTYEYTRSNSSAYLNG